MLNPKSFRYSLDDDVATLTLDRPDTLNSLTFEVYAELRDTFRALEDEKEIRAVVLTGAGRGFCSGGSVHDIIGPLFDMDAAERLRFTRMTGALIGAIRGLRKPVVAAVNGVAAGAGAVIALACDFRVMAENAKIAFLFVKVGLAGADMGAAWLLPQVIGLGRANELLMLGEPVLAARALEIGLTNRVVPVEQVLAESQALAARLARGPSFALGVTKEMLNREPTMSLEEALEAEAQAQQICMDTRDFREAYEAFVAKREPGFEGRWMVPPANPFLEARHIELAADAAKVAEGLEHEEDPRQLVAWLAEAGLLRACVPAAFGGRGSVELRELCVVRDALAYRSSLADTMFGMQGLGSYPVTLAGSEEQKADLLPRVAAGQAICAFAITEPEAGSDVSSLSTRATPEAGPGAGGWRLDGEKCFISNAGIADSYVVFARTSDDKHRGISAFLVNAPTAGLAVEPTRLIAPHPIGVVRFDGCPARLLGEVGGGFALAMQTLDHFRASVGAAALGMARRALDEALSRARSRKQFGKPLAEFQATQMALADMKLDVETSRLLVLQAAHAADTSGAARPLDAALAKLHATEAAQRVIDRSLQLHGGQGVVAGAVVERLYREVRALRIYEGTSEIQKLVIARHLLRNG